MNRQHILIHELPVAKITPVLLFRRVNSPQVVAQIPVALERFRADLANADVIRMPRHVYVNGRSGFSAITAVLAMVQSLAAVRPEVNFHGGFR